MTILKELSDFKYNLKSLYPGSLYSLNQPKPSENLIYDIQNNNTKKLKIK